MADADPPPPPVHMNGHAILHPEEAARLIRAHEPPPVEEPQEETSCCTRKYCDALKLCLPCRPKRKNKEAIPINDVGFFSYISVSWLSKLMWKAYKKGLEPSDLWDIQEADAAETHVARLEKLWDEEIKEAKAARREPDLSKALWKLIRTRMYVAMLIAIIQNILQFLGPSILVKMTLDYISEPGEDHIYATLIVLAVFCVNALRSASFNLNFIISIHAGIRVIGALQAIMYKKILRLRSGGEQLSAQMVNISTNDMERLFEASVATPFLIAAPVMFLACAFYIVHIVGMLGLMGLFVFLLFYPIMGVIATLQSKVRTNTVKYTDQRVTLMGEILGSIRLIKMYSWEDSFADKIKNIRSKEMKELKKGALLAAISSTVTPSISILGTITTILMHTLFLEPLTSSEAFTIYSVFNAMQFSVGVLPYAIRSLVEGKVSILRIQKLITMSDFEPNDSGVMSNSKAVNIKGATFAWEERNIDFKKMNQKDLRKQNANNNAIPKTEDKDLKYIETLFNINFSVRKGKLIGICGSVGAGKSSLLSAICGDMKLQSGKLQLNGKLAIATQIPWIYNDTLRENIIVGGEFDQERYDRVLEVTCLKQDLNLLPNGDLTEIGEKGVNLSGGQKQRLNISRALYSNRDIYLLDDPLSAVDTRVAKHIFNHCIKRALRGKTVLLVTHATHFLEKCDEIVVLKEGKIAERGNHEELMNRGGEYHEMVRYDSARDNENMDVDNNLNANVEDNEDQGDAEMGQLIEKEQQNKGGLDWKDYLIFMKASGGWCVAFIILLATIIFTLARLFNIIWLQMWMDAGDGLYSIRLANITASGEKLSEEELRGHVTDNEDLDYYQFVYLMSFVCFIGIGVIKSLMVSFRILAGSSKLHSYMFKSILSSPLSFFDKTPSGRILNRFSRDIDELDVRIPFFIGFVMDGLLSLVGQLILTCVIYPWFIVPLLIIKGVFITVDIFLNAGVRELKRLDNGLKSPVLQHITSSISGLSVIRTYGKEQLFLERFYKLLNKHSVSLMVFRCATRWFTFRMDFLAIVVTVSITIICVFTKNTVSTATAGVALSTINGVCVFIPFLMRMKSEFMSRITSLERINQYAFDLESEADRVKKDDPPKSEWPKEGAIEIKDITLKYRENLPLVLHGISASIKPGEKIGIVGRTGAGKSSVISALLRLVELESGEICIDEKDIKYLGLKTLRSSISVIPQDPVLFQGTMRYNLDPFDEHSDDNLWRALEKSHLKEVVQKLENGLLAKVDAAGENFSVGEKQLICLTRALLRNTKVLLLDEATASVDMETDHLIQIAIKEAFEGCTVLTIAHRLNTVASYNRILVLDAGMVKEFDSPKNLMEDKSSTFHDMMVAMGINTVEDMQNLVQID